MEEVGVSSTPSATGAPPEGGASAVTEVVSEQATKVKEKGRRELREQLDQRTNDIGRQARSLADALRRAGTESSATDPAVDGIPVDRIASGVADRIEQAGSYLERAPGEELLRDAERFVRTRPWLVAGAAAAVGFTLSRLLRASSESRYDAGTANTGDSQGWPAPTRGAREDGDVATVRPVATAGVAST